ncbi:unnamed protein product [Clonostachys rosea]|uniref:RNA polymerase II-associated protein 1 N-terminal domain-containing protein n=1 Tax=Bionectria ochroleuca TaxID=29856 RepID=A0ABY6TQU8_BIOOC|nr:unnamed protein product [Clonostachys rosea]
MESGLLIGDIVERKTGAEANVEFTDNTISSTGFPQHKRRWKSSAFKQSRSQNVNESDVSPAGGNSRNEGPNGGARESSHATSFEEVERKRIDHENRQKLDDMTPEEIAQAQKDILNGLNPALIQRLLQRSTIDDPEPNIFELTQDEQLQNSSTATPPEITVSAPDQPAKASSPSTETPTENRPPLKMKDIADDYDEDAEPPQLPDLFPITDPPTSTHFPAPPQVPDLDPDDPNFLQNLHEKYFPELPSDPSKLAWMAPVPTPNSVADKESPYYPHPEIAVSALRFDFRGRFLSPRVSRTIPSSVGLHHHGEAPEAAGYTIDELSRLARSAVPSQRCIAFQTLGRILFRLGNGEWGKTENDPIAMGVWSSVKKGRAIESLTEAATVEGGHRGSKAYATEALWLYEKGGWKEKFKGR